MSWMVVDPKYSTTEGTKVARVGVPFFPDHIEYEQIMGRAFEGEEFRAWRERGGVVILATEEGYQKLESLMGSQFADVPEMTVRNECTKLALERQVVVLRWVTDH